MSKKELNQVSLPNELFIPSVTKTQLISVFSYGYFLSNQFVSKQRRITECSHVIKHDLLQYNLTPKSVCTDSTDLIEILSTLVSITKPIEKSDIVFAAKCYFGSLN